MVTRRLLVLSGDKVTNKRAKSERNACFSFAFPSGSNLSKVTNKRAKRKKERKLFFFLFRVPVTSAKPKLRISERKAKEKLAFLSLFRAEVTYLKLRNLYSCINYAGRPVRPTRYQPRATPWESLMCNSRPERAKALPKHHSFALSFNRTGRSYASEKPNDYGRNDFKSITR